jgi:hypothetical protein
MSGPLTKITVELNGSFDNLTVQVRTTTAGAPDSGSSPNVLATESFGPRTLSGTETLTVTLSQTPEIMAGTMYAVVLGSTTSIFNNPRTSWLGDTSGGYSRGGAFVSENQGSTWGKTEPNYGTVLTNADFSFATYTVGNAVEASPIPPWLQAYGRASANATCLDGWNPSWHWWPNNGTGGFVCQREIPSLG